MRAAITSSPFNAFDPGRTTPEADVITRRIGDSTVEGRGRDRKRARAIDKPGRRVSRGLPDQQMCARCGEEASAAITTRFHLKMPSQLSSWPAPWIHGGLSVTGLGFDHSLAHCETPRAQAWSTDFLGQTTWHEGDRGREFVPERQH